MVVRTLYVTCVRPTLEYASGAWGGLGKEDANRLEHLQRCAARTIAKVSLADKMPNELLLARAGLEPLSVRRLVAVATPTYLMLHDPPKGPTHLQAAFNAWLASAPPSSSGVTLRSASSGDLRLPRPRTELLRRSPFYRAVSLLNSLSSETKTSLSALKSHILSSSD